MARVLGQGPEDNLEGRIRLAAAAVVLVFGIFGLRMFQLQIIEGEVLARLSEKNSIRLVRLEAPRGQIVDREGRVFVTTRPAFGLQIVPNDLRDTAVTYAALEQLLDLDVEWLRERVGKPRGARRFQPVKLLDDLSFDHLARVETHRYALPGVVTDVRPRRHYLEDNLAAHLLGSIGEINQKQLDKRRADDYRPGDYIGQTGLEARLEDHLHGRAGGRNVVVDVAGRVVDVVNEVAPVPGGTAVLALDLDLQREAEAAFSDIPEGEAPRMGALVAMDPRNGDILAMVSRPAYDPNAFAGGIGSETWKAITSDPWKPLRNRAIQNHYPPGSTYKAIVAAALLEENVVTPETSVFCPGYYRFGRRNYRCWKRSGHGWVNLHDALKRSCDVFFYQHGVKLGIDALARHAKSFQLGVTSGVGLYGEVPGLIPSTDWKERRLGEPWYPGETVSASIGQGYDLMTPIQLAVSYAAIANGGHVLKPRLLLRLETQDGKVMETFEPSEHRQLEIAPEHLATVRSGLTAVVEESGGTGGRARVAGVRVAGKTGTAQVVKLQVTEGLEEDEIPIHQRDHAWFASFAPAEAAEIVVAVFVEHGKHGSSGAAPLAQRVMARYFEKKAARAQLEARAPAADAEPASVLAATQPEEPDRAVD